MIDIQQLIEADKELLLTLNGSSSLFWDGFIVDCFRNKDMDSGWCYVAVYHIQEY